MYVEISKTKCEMNTRYQIPRGGEMVCKGDRRAFVEPGSRSRRVVETQSIVEPIFVFEKLT